MRCKQCGWPNRPNERFCVKCNSPLEAEPAPAAQEPVRPVGTETSSPLKQTVREDGIFGSRQQPYDSSQFADSYSQPAETQPESVSCPKCGYPLRQGAVKCPNCRFELRRVEPQPTTPGANNQDHEVPRRVKPTRLDNGMGGGQAYRGTINPYMMNYAAEPTFVLTPVRRMNERGDLESIEYEGNEVTLSRGNTEERNPTISSSQQALVTRVDGHWGIEDKSGQRTTFVQAAQRIQLHEGDLILLGNRLFEFHENN